MTPDARYLAFESDATNLSGTPDTNGMRDIFVKDRVTGAVDLVSVSTAGIQGDQPSQGPSISADGRYVVFSSTATTLLGVPDANGTRSDVFVRDRVLGTTQLVSCSASGVQGDRGSAGASISSDGRYVVFVSEAVNLLGAWDHNGFTVDVYLKDLQTGTVELVNVSNAGVQTHLAAGAASMSSDARYVVFASQDPDLVAPDTNGTIQDVFLRDRQLGTTERISLSSAGLQADGWNDSPTVSADGRWSRSRAMPRTSAACRARTRFGPTFSSAIARAARPSWSASGRTALSGTPRATAPRFRPTAGTSYSRACPRTWQDPSTSKNPRTEVTCSYATALPERPSS
jgi:Tol biopolymer transport system component